jgi:hypothetical protein
MSNQNKEKKTYNVTVTALWDNEKFGEGALLSAEIDDKAFEAIQTIEKGMKLLIKPRERDGKTTYFMEVLPPYAKQAVAKPGFNNKAKSAPRRANDDDL